MATIAFYFLLAFLCSINQASEENHPYHTTTICNVNEHIRVQITNFLTLREVLVFRMTSSKLFEKYTSQINTENAEYFKPFLNFGYDKNIGFALTRYCSTLHDDWDSYTLRFINNNIENLKKSKIFFNSYVFLFNLDDGHYDCRIFFGGIGEYAETNPVNCTIGRIGELKMNENAIVANMKDHFYDKFLVVGDPNYYENQKPKKTDHAKDGTYRPFCTAHTCSIWHHAKSNLFSWGNFNVENEIAPPQEMLEDVVQVASNDQAICAIFSDGKIKSWGNPHFGGKIPENIEHLLSLNQIEEIYSTKCAFAAVSLDGNVFAWGNPNYGGKIPEHMQLSPINIKKIAANEGAFAALTNDGKIFTWGNPLFGGEIPEHIQEIIFKITATAKAFAALSFYGNGNVFAWGDPNYGGKIPEHIQLSLQNIKGIAATEGAFAALSEDGKVYAWGNPLFGGEIPEDIQENIHVIKATAKAFAALSLDGNVFAWGDPNYGGVIPEEIQAKLYNVPYLYGNEKTGQFEALFNDGNKVVWP